MLDTRTVEIISAGRYHLILTVQTIFGEILSLLHFVLFVNSFYLFLFH